MAEKPQPLRILAVSALWQGANDYAYVRAFQRLGHSVSVVSSDRFVPDWQGRSLRAVRRLLMPKIVAEFNSALLAQAQATKPDLLFVFKGAYVKPETIAAIKSGGVVAINFFPDTGFADHGPYLPKAIGLYDWVFTTKTAGVADLAARYGCRNAGFVAHSFDPEVHAPLQLSSDDLERYACDVSFIGNISKKKCQTLQHVARRLPDLKLFIWGAAKWGQVPDLAHWFQGRAVWGHEYSKAIQASSINLGLLFEGGPSAPAGDQITSRTFHIPACGGFMLHERTEEALGFFKEGQESAFYGDADELVAQISHYLDHPALRARIARAGYNRALSSGYSVDVRVQQVLDTYRELLGAMPLSR
ncbi:MAG: glycosyltransferase [Rhizobiales bacterium]|nr:glycosyltransferase [Hyphomicrobiales bacterium]